MAALLFASLSQIIKASNSSNLRQCGPKISDCFNLRKEQQTTTVQQSLKYQQPKIRSEHVISLRVGPNNNLSSCLKNTLGSESAIVNRRGESGNGLIPPKTVPFCVKRSQDQAEKQAEDLTQDDVTKRQPSVLGSILSNYYYTVRHENDAGEVECKSRKPKSQSHLPAGEHLRDKALWPEFTQQRSDMDIRVHRLGPDRAIITNMFTPEEDRSEDDKTISESNLSEHGKDFKSTSKVRLNTASPVWTSPEESSIVPFPLHERSPSKASCYSDSGISAMYTSTPIKSSGDGEEVRHQGPTTSRHNPLPSSREYRPGLSVSQASALSITPASLYDDSLAQVLETGDDEFRRKYSSWVSQLFHLQLTKMHRRLCHHFGRKIDQVVQEKEEELLRLRQKHHNKLRDLELEVERFKKVIDSLTEDNRRLLKTKETIEEELRKTMETSKKNFEAELERQINNVQAECEREKLLMQQKHGDQLKIFLDKSCEQIEKVENDYRSQVDALTRRVRDLQARNESLEEQLKLAKRVDNSGPNTLRTPLASGSYCFRREKEHLLSVIQDLRNKLYDSEKEKLTLMATHEEEVSSLNSIIRSTEKEYMQKWETSQRNFETLRQAKEEEIQKLRAHIVQHDQECQEIIDSLRQKYGSKIESLTEMVQRLHLEMESRHTTPETER